MILREPGRRQGRQLRRRGQGVERGQDRGPRPLSRQRRRPGDRRQHAGDQRAPLGGLRQGSGRERGPLVVARRGAPGAGGRRALLRARDRARRPLRPLRRHPQPGLRRHATRRPRRPTARSRRRRGRSSPTEAGRRPPITSRPPAGKTENSEFGFSGGSSIPYLKSVDDPFDDASPVHNWTETLSDDRIEAGAHRPVRGQPAEDRGDRDRQVAADRHRAGWSAARLEHGHRRHPAGAARACGRPGRGSGTASGPAPPAASARYLRADGDQQNTISREGKAKAEAELKHLTRGSPAGDRPGDQGRRASSAT